MRTPKTRKPLVIQIKYGGLGDHLFYSHLPRVAKLTKTYDHVFVSNQSEYRHLDYRRLVWELNPYVDGFCDEPGFYPQFAQVEPNMNILDKIMLLQGIDDGKRFHEPELYFKPEIISELEDKSVYDPNFVSYVGNLSAEFVESYFAQHNIFIDYQMKLRDKGYPIRSYKHSFESISLEHFCSIIVSCKQLYCLTSGTATLASALGKTATVFYGEGQAPMFHHSKLHRYILLTTEMNKILESNIEKIIKKPIITMSSLGKNGRFANQIFQYAFLKIYAKEHNLMTETSEWIGQYLFGHNDPPISHKLPEVRVQPKTDYMADALIPKSQTPFNNVDFWGYFQYHTRYYAPHKEYFCSLFKPVPEIEAKMRETLNKLRSIGRTIVGLHLRRKDYGYGPFFIAPNEWYKEWLSSLWKSLNEPLLFIASDEPKKVISDFDDYRPIIVKDLGIELPKAEYYPDFYLLSQCDIVAISNSSYSFAACMLNENCKLFLRPHLPSKKLIPFDPWNSEVLFYDEEILQLAQDYLRKGNIKQAEAICKEIIKTHPYDVIRFASICIEKSQQLDQSYEDASYILGLALQEIGGIDIAIPLYQKTLQLNPNHDEAYNHLENAIREKRRLNKEAISCYKNQQLAELCKNKFNDVYRENYQFLADRTFIVCAMFTPNKPSLFQYANRLVSSCEKYRLPYIIYEVPGIHKSISPQGQEDLAFTKANFIYFNMLRFPTKNILYLDIDVLFVDHPDVIVEISKAGYDFAIYNWLNDEHNEAYIPINRKIELGNIYSDFYMFSHCIGYHCSEQLICSGAAQFYKNSIKAKYLLESWQGVIANNPGYADDECLDYTYNNFILDLEDLEPFWLDKSYCRYPWWPHIKPIILHPDLPYGGRSCHITEINNRQRFYPIKCKPKLNLFLFPPDYIIDTKNRLLLKIINDQITDRKTIKQDFWIYPEDFELSK
jgi:tetratricopeptide (TPR) repeat protein